jgi:(R,R)-butanediol dehydrogenase/meso-butanediol dehydrogenase/diacetyl reductase
VIAALAARGFEITAVDIDPSRLAVATSLGATTTHLINRDMSDENVAELLGTPADCVIETSGVPGAVQRAIRLVVRGGKVVIVGLNKSPDSLLLADVVLREISLTSSVAHVCDRNLGESLQSLSQRPLADILPVKIIAIEDAESQGLQRIADGSAGGKLLVGFES